MLLRRFHELCHSLSSMRLHALEKNRVYTLQVGLQPAAWESLWQQLWAHADGLLYGL